MSDTDTLALGGVMSDARPWSGPWKHYGERFMCSECGLFRTDFGFMTADMVCQCEGSN